MGLEFIKAKAKSLNKGCEEPVEVTLIWEEADKAPLDVSPPSSSLTLPLLAQDSLEG